MSAVHRTVTPALLACSIFITIFFSACADKIKSNLIAFEALGESLDNSNASIDRQSQNILASLNDKLTGPMTAEKAAIWYPKAKLVQKLTEDAYIYIEGLKSDLKKEAGLKTNEDKESFKESDKNAVMRLFIKKEKGMELYEHLRNYKREVLLIDPQLDSAFGKTLQVTAASFEASQNKEQDFTKIFFDDIPAIAALAMLSKFQNNVKVIENKIVEFCHNRIGSTDDQGLFSIYAAFAFINSSYIKANEEVEITSGVGAFSKAAQPVISIDGKNVSLDSDGAAHYKFKASDKPGRHFVPVEISFTDEEGRKQIVTKNIQYTVAGN